VLNLEWMIPLFSLFLIAMIWSAVLWQVNTDKVRSQLEMQRQSENLVRVFEEHISRTIRAVDQSVLFLKYEYESEGNKMDLPHYQTGHHPEPVVCADCHHRPGRHAGNVQRAQLQAG
jgi:hypothetical protein